MITVNWLQSKIYALTKGFFLAHFVQLLPVSSGFDPKPIKPTGGFQFNSKGFESGHLLCLQQGSSELNRDRGTLHVGLNQVSALHNGGKGVDLLFFAGVLFVVVFLFNLQDSLSETEPVFLSSSSLFHPGKGQALSGRLSRRTPAKSLCLQSPSPLEASVTHNPNLWLHVPVLAPPRCQRSSLAGLARLHGDRGPGWLPLALPPAIAAALQCRESQRGLSVCCSEWLSAGKASSREKSHCDN